MDPTGDAAAAAAAELDPLANATLVPRLSRRARRSGRDSAREQAEETRAAFDPRPHGQASFGRTTGIIAVVIIATTTTDGHAVVVVATVRRPATKTTLVDPSSRDIECQQTPRPAPAPPFDASHARIICSTTEVAISSLTDSELGEHVEALKRTERLAREALEYWSKMRESALGDKEAFEGVIENLVGFVKKSRR